MINNDFGKEKYFLTFNDTINNLKENKSIEIEELEKLFTDISAYSDLNFQDIITYLLYCFEVIELTGKWKLKKLINYSYFLENMEDIYKTVFCNTTTGFKNKIVSTTSFENIIEKTINYNIEQQIEPVLNIYLNCLSNKQFYMKDTNLVLLRGNIYCGIYNSLKENKDVSEIISEYLDLVGQVFDYDRYLNGAIPYYKNLLNHATLTYFELNNYLLFKTYNNFLIEKDDLKKVLKLLLKKYPNEYFDKKVFITIFKSLISNLSNKKKIDIDSEIVFENKDNINNTIYLNYNAFNSSFYDNSELLKTLFKSVNSIKYENFENESNYVNLLKVKDILIDNDYDSLYSYKNMLQYISMLDLYKYLGQTNIQNIDEYYEQLMLDYKNKRSCLLSDNECLEKKYSVDDFKVFIEKYPVLAYEYNVDGTYKSIADIITTKNKLLNDLTDNADNDISNQINILDSIIKYRNCDLSSLLKDYYSLLLMDTIDSNLIKEKEYVLKEVLPKLVLQYIKFYGKIKKSELDEIYEDYINPCIKRISQNRVNNKSFDSTKDFLNFEKSNSDNYVGICKLQEILKTSN